MILPDLLLYSRANRRHLYSGMDSFENCYDRQHFQNYPYNIEYLFNSRGFRDAEWPVSVSDLASAIWCIGDSFTVGIGQAGANIWPRVLQERLQRRCINVSLDGASNQWIARKAIDINRTVRPTHLVVMWSYVHRRESTDNQLPDENRRVAFDPMASAKDDFENFKSCVQSLINENIPYLHQFIIPKAFPMADDIWGKIRDPSWPLRCPVDLTLLSDSIQQELRCKFELWDQLIELNNDPGTNVYLDTCEFLTDSQITQVPQLDIARDGHHFDLLTSRWIVDQICDRWTL